MREITRVSGGVSERFAHNVSFGPRFSVWNGSHSRCMVGRNFLTSNVQVTGDRVGAV